MLENLKKILEFCQSRKVSTLCQKYLKFWRLDVITWLAFEGAVFTATKEKPTCYQIKISFISDVER